MITPDKRFDVFVSYSRADEPLYEKLQAELDKFGIRVCQPTSFQQPGETWANVIGEAVDHCKIAVVVNSDNSHVNADQTLGQEWGVIQARKWSENLNVATINVDDSSTPGFLRDCPKVDVSRDAPDLAKCADLVSRLVHIADQAPVSRSAVNEVSQPSENFRLLRLLIDDARKLQGSNE